VLRSGIGPGTGPLDGSGGAAGPGRLALDGLDPGQRVAGGVIASVDTSALQGVARVDFVLDDAVLRSEVAPPFCIGGDGGGECFSWDTTTVDNGTHTVLVRALDESGDVIGATPDVRFTVANPQAEATDQAPRASREGVLWSAHAEEALSREWAAGNAADVHDGLGTSTTDEDWAGTSRVRQVTAPVAKGERAYAISVSPGDFDAYTSGAQRTELGQNNTAREFWDGTGDRQFRHGHETWQAWSVFLPASFPAGPSDDGWLDLMQWKTEGLGNGPFALALEDGRLQLDRSVSQEYASTDIETIWRSDAPVARDTWLRFVMHTKWSASGDGFVTLHGDLADGQGMRELMPRIDRWTLKLDEGGEPGSVGWRFGQYRSGVPGGGTVYFDGLAVGRTRAAAEAEAF
jgi:hypothetical protein